MHDRSLGAASVSRGGARGVAARGGRDVRRTHRDDRCAPGPAADPPRRRRWARARPRLAAGRRDGRRGDPRGPGKCRAGNRARVSASTARVRATDPAAVTAAARAFGADLVVVGPGGAARGRRGRRHRRRGHPGLRAERSGGPDREQQGLLPRDRRGRGRPDGPRPRVRRARARPHLRAELARAGGGVVVKADGLAAGKGVTVCDDVAEARRGARRGLRGRRRSRRRAAGGRRGAPPRPGGERHRPVRRHARPWPCPPPATTSGWATATRARTPAAWAPTRRSPTSTTALVAEVAGPLPPPGARRAGPPRHARSAARCTPA